MEISNIVTVVVAFCLLATCFSALFPAPLSPALQAFRALFPTWRFFDDLAPSPQLFVRVSSDGTQFDGWRSVGSKCKRAWWRLIINPGGNLSLAAASLLERLEIETSSLSEHDGETLEHSTTFLLVKALAQTEIQSHSSQEAPTQGGYFQFQLCQFGTPNEPFLISKIYRVLP